MIYSPAEINYIIENYYSYTAKELSVVLNRTISSVRAKINTLMNNGLLNNKKVCKYLYNKNYFDNITLETSYWAGFIAADGYIGKNGNNTTLEIDISRKDICHLELFKNTIEAENRIEIFDRADKDTGAIKKKCRLRLNGANHLTDTLSKIYNIIPNKTLNSIPPQLLYPYDLSFIKGLIDGDGSIYFSRVKTSKYKKFNFNISGQITMLTWVQDTFAKYVNDYTKVNLTYTKNCYLLSKSYKQALNVLNVLKDLSTPELNRKWSKIGLLSKSYI